MRNGTFYFYHLLKTPMKVFIIIFLFKFYLFLRSQIYDVCFAWQWPILCCLYAMGYFAWRKL